MNRTTASNPAAPTSSRSRQTRSRVAAALVAGPLLATLLTGCVTTEAGGNAALSSSSTATRAQGTAAVTGTVALTTAGTSSPATRRAAARHHRERVHHARVRRARLARRAAAKRRAAAQRAAKRRAALARTVAAYLAVNPPVKAPFQVASFNMLGASHTDGTSPERHGWPVSTTRARAAGRLFNHLGLDLIGAQEFQPPQQAAFRARFGNQFGFVVGDGPGRPNAVIWRLSRFSLVSSTMVDVPYFGGQSTPMPVVTLQDRTTGQNIVVLSVHNPADVHGPAGTWRTQAVGIERAYLDTVRAAGNSTPVFWLGDMNDRAAFVCPATAGGDFVTAADPDSAVAPPLPTTPSPVPETPATPARAPIASATPGPTAVSPAAPAADPTAACTPPAYGGIDWVLGSRGVTFTGWTVDRVTQARKISDHPLVYATTGSPAATAH